MKQPLRFCDLEPYHKCRLVVRYTDHASRDEYVGLASQFCMDTFPAERQSNNETVAKLILRVTVMDRIPNAIGLADLEKSAGVQAIPGSRREHVTFVIDNPHVMKKKKRLWIIADDGIFKISAADELTFMMCRILRPD